MGPALSSSRRRCAASWFYRDLCLSRCTGCRDRRADCQQPSLPEPTHGRYSSRPPSWWRSRLPQRVRSPGCGYCPPLIVTHRLKGKTGKAKADYQALVVRATGLPPHSQGPVIQQTLEKLGFAVTDVEVEGDSATIEFATQAVSLPSLRCHRNARLM